MRWVAVGALGWVVGCSGSEREEPVTPFVPPAPGATESSGGTGAAAPANPTPPADPAMAGSTENPNAGIMGGVMGAPAPVEGGAAPATMPGAPAGGSGGAGMEMPSEPAPEMEPVAPIGSSGCGTAPAPGEFTIPLNGANAAFTVTVPPDYDLETPTPLVFAFHGRNRTHIDLRTIDAGNIQTELGSRYIVVYPKSQGGPGWNFAAEVPPSVAFFDALYPRMLESYCVDTSRVFAVGHSSGGYFSIILACRYGSLLRGIGSVAGALQESMCSDESVAGMFIHGANDTVVANSGGRAARDQLLARNGCGQSTVAASVAPCVAYDSCPAGFPVQWCEHQEPTYLDQGRPTNHGWPSFASRAIREFFETLP